MAFEFVIHGQSDSDYAKNPEKKWIILNTRVFSIMFRSGTQKYVFLSVTDAELRAGVTGAQDMLYVMQAPPSLELKVKLPMCWRLITKKQ